MHEHTHAHTKLHPHIYTRMHSLSGKWQLCRASSWTYAASRMKTLQAPLCASSRNSTHLKTTHASTKQQGPLTIGGGPLGRALPVNPNPNPNLVKAAVEGAQARQLPKHDGGPLQSICPLPGCSHNLHMMLGVTTMRSRCVKQGDGLLVFFFFSFFSTCIVFFQLVLPMHLYLGMHPLYLLALVPHLPPYAHPLYLYLCRRPAPAMAFSAPPCEATGGSR